jgi:hypothetical protein
MQIILKFIKTKETNLIAINFYKVTVIRFEKKQRF